MPAGPPCAGAGDAKIRGTRRHHNNDNRHDHRYSDQNYLPHTMPFSFLVYCRFIITTNEARVQDNFIAIV